MNIWIVAASDDASFANIPKSLTGAVPLDVLSRAGVSYQGDIYAWGAKNGKSNIAVLKRMKTGDLCLFYTKSEPDPGKKYNWAARVKGVKQSKQLSTDIWGTDLFELVYFLDKPWVVTVSRAQINKTLGYDAEYFPRGLMRTHISDEQLQAVQKLLGAGELRPDLPSTTSTTKEVKMSKFLDEAVAAIAKTGFRFEPTQLRRFVCALAAKPFIILTGNSGTGKTKLAEIFGQGLSGDQKQRFAIVPVGADWTDNRNVLGFVNHLRLTKLADESAVLPIYQSTKVLDLLLAARAESALPFFLILDEMNLSHVERYFSDFLSTLESKDGIIMLHREDRELPRKPGGIADVPAELALPRNVFVIGTVNVDETTYMFSPKVLDRANVLEFRVNSAAPKEFLQSGGRPVGDIVAAPLGFAESYRELSYRARGLNGAAPLGLIADPANPPADAVESLQKCHQTIADLFGLMQQQHQEFAFRSMAEILRFLAIDYELTNDKAKWDYQAAMDAQILQKILPKLHGSRKRIEPLLLDLARYCETGSPPKDGDSYKSKYETLPLTRVRKPSEAGKEDQVRFRTSYDKLCDMIDTVRVDQFVSFIR